MIHLAGLPIPPSVNHAYATVMAQGKVRRISSKPLVTWREAFDHWCWQNTRRLALSREILKGWEPRIPLRIDCAFILERDRMLLNDGRIRKHDTSNMLKPLHDAIADILYIDDSRFWDGAFSKRVALPGQPEVVNIAISVVNL